MLEQYTREQLQTAIERANPSQAELIRRGLEAERYEWITCNREACDGRPHEGMWRKHARPQQMAPPGSWITWLVLAGRGHGKTRLGVEWLKGKALASPRTRWAVVAPTFSDCRDTCLEGESGLLSVLPPSAVEHWNRSMGELVLENGSRIKCFSAEEPERLRGPQHHGAYCDELAAWTRPEAWDQLQFGLRLGENPQTVVTTTPRPTKLIRELVKRDGVHVTRGSTFDNAANLAPAALAELKAKYEDTRLGRQELYAELLLDTPGAVATYDLLDMARVKAAPECIRTLVSVDPAVTATLESDETGIAVQSRGVDGDCYAIADRSCRLAVDQWSRRAVQAAVEYEAGMILYEKNQGADAIGSILKTAMREMGVSGVIVKEVTASKSKFDRALPLQQWIEQGRWHLVGSFPELEEQFTSWTIDSASSPDRLDAVVHGFTELMLQEKSAGFFFGDL